MYTVSGHNGTFGAYIDYSKYVVCAPLVKSSLQQCTLSLIAFCEANQVHIALTYLCTMQVHGVL